MGGFWAFRWSEAAGTTISGVHEERGHRLPSRSDVIRFSSATGTTSSVRSSAAVLAASRVSGTDSSGSTAHDHATPHSGSSCNSDAAGPSSRLVPSQSTVLLRPVVWLIRARAYRSPCVRLRQLRWKNRDEGRTLASPDTCRKHGGP